MKKNKLLNKPRFHVIGVYADSRGGEIREPLASFKTLPQARDFALEAMFVALEDPPLTECKAVLVVNDQGKEFSRFGSIETHAVDLSLIEALNNA